MPLVKSVVDRNNLKSYINKKYKNDNEVDIV